MKPSYLTLMIFIFLLLFIPVSTLLPRATASASSQTTILSHTFQIDSYGQIIIEDALVFKNDGSTGIPLKPIEITYPENYFNHIASGRVSSSINFTEDISKVDESTRVTLSPVETYNIPAKSNLTVEWRMMLIELPQQAGSNRYNFTVSLIPGFNIPLDTASSKILLPPKLKFSENIPEFVKKQEQGLETWSRNFTDLDVNESRVFDATLEFLVPSAEFSIVEFTEASRELIISTSGEIKVREMIRLINYGNSTLTTLRLNLLDPKITKVATVPISQPPLMNGTTVQVFDQILSLELGLDRVVEKDEMFVIRYEYPLPKNLIVIEDDVYSVTIPLTPPVQGAVKRFVVNIDLGSGFRMVSGGPLTYKVSNSSSIDDEKIDVSFRPNASWAIEDIFPIASAVFVFTFLALLIGVGREEKVSKEAPKRLNDFVRNFEDKIASIEDALSSLLGRARGEVTRARIAEARRSIEEIRSRSSTRVGELKSSLLSIEPELKMLIDQIVDADREYDRSIRELLNLYEQFYRRRMKKETFHKSLSAYRKRVKRASDRITEYLSAIQREFEE